jgi:hypothetical protein
VAIFGRHAVGFRGNKRSQSVVARAAKSILCVNGENGLASDGTLQERYEYTPYGERRKRHDERFGPARFSTMEKNPPMTTIRR